MTDWDKVMRGAFVEFREPTMFSHVAPIEFDKTEISIHQYNGEMFYIPASVVRPVLPLIATEDPLEAVDAYISWSLRQPHLSRCFYYSQQGPKCNRCYAEAAHAAMRRFRGLESAGGG
jgi:hypothetical protein